MRRRSGSAERRARAVGRGSPCGRVGTTGGSTTIDRITLTGVTAIGFHGVFPHERREGQPFVVDVILELPLETSSDELDDTVSYADVATMVESVITGEPRNLIETVAGEIATRCLEHGRVVGVTVTVHKPRAPLSQHFADVAVTISRSRDV
ncbi:dihydroneopterin aldolase [Tessaracoccus sp. MC1679]|nr:dihydroneopterin aldolase [Tessaracoccus sp. MC1679]